MDEAAADYLPATDMPRFIREMMEFVELSDRDVTAIRSSAPIVLRHTEALTAALYERFLALRDQPGSFCGRTAVSTPNDWNDASTPWLDGSGRPRNRASSPITCSTWAWPTATEPTVRAGKFLPI